MNYGAFDFQAPDYELVYKARMERLEHLRSGTPEEVAAKLAGVKEHYAENPVDFVNDWGMTFDPRNLEIGLPAVVPFVVFKRQAQFIEWVHALWRGREDGLVEKSRDMGISWLSVGFAVWMWCFKKDSVVGFGSRKEEYVDKLGDPKSLFWKVRSFIDMLPEEFKPKGYEEKIHAPHMRVVNPENGATIVGEAGDNIGRGARTSIYFKDESAFYEHPESIDAALSQTSNCKVDLSTPNGVGNPFHRKRFGGRVKVFIFDWKDDPRKGKDWYADQKGKLDAVIVAQEIDRDYSASVTNSYIPGVQVTAAQMRGPMEVQAIGPLMVGLDVARFGDDKCVLTFRQGRIVLRQIVWGKTDLVDTAGRAKDEINQWPDKPTQIAVDTVGLGAGVADILRRDFPSKFINGEEYPVVVDVSSGDRLDDGENYNLRARMWRDMRDWLKAGASIPTDAELTIDLSGLRYGYRSGLLLIESKEDAKRRGVKSPDRADSIALTFAHPPKIPSVMPMGAETWTVLDDLVGY